MSDLEDGEILDSSGDEMPNDLQKEPTVKTDVQITIYTTLSPVLDAFMLYF